MSTNKFKDPHLDENKFLQNLFLSGVALVNKIPYLRYLAINFGFCLYNLNKASEFKSNNFHKSFSRRESLWNYIIEKLKNQHFSVLEFGVAWGYCTNFWLLRCNNINSWHGYDTFDGLPESWRHYKKGHFSNQGEPPAIDDDRLNWTKGLVEDTFFWNENIFRPNNEPLLIFFDMDLFSPTYFVLSKLSKHLKKGDIIYFDESFDIDESSILHFLIKLNLDKLEIIGNTPCQTMIIVKEDKIFFPAFI
jgi:hypothetical protein